MINIALYPLKFQPIIKDKIWGGNKLKVKLGKNGGEYSGESWELSGVEGNQSVVANGELKGKHLNELIEIFKENFLGSSTFEKFGKEFPLLIKFIDAKQDLSIQVHPNDKQSNGHGKTEMWYVLETDPSAYLLSGFNKNVKKEELIYAIKEGDFENYMNRVPVKPGDTFFIKANHVHSIGAGVLLAEIQQTSDITYRIYDFNRKDETGALRELHIDDAFNVMYLGQETGLVKYDDKSIRVRLVNVPEFCTTKYKLDSNKSLSIMAPLDHFLILIGVKGKSTIAYMDKTETFNFGETIFLPPGIKIDIIPDLDFEYLETYVK